MTLTGHATVLVVRDMAVAAAYYRERLGFAVHPWEEEPESYAACDRDGCSVHLARADDGAPVHPNRESVVPDLFDAYFWPDDVDALFEELKRRGATVVHGPVDQPYGLREFRLADPDGHILAFGRRL